MDKPTLELTREEVNRSVDSGYGYGYGGDGSGSGDGSGEEMQIYFEALLSPHKKLVPAMKVCFWRSNGDGTPCNGGNGKAAFVGKVEEIQGPLKLCSPNALHGTLSPKEWKGERLWIVGLHKPVVGDGSKFGSLKRTILADLGKCPF